MADLVRDLQSLQRLPKDLHLFCPRLGNDDEYYFDEDVLDQLDTEEPKAKERRLQKVKEAEERKTLVLNGIKIMAYDGEDAKPYKDWLESRLNKQMMVCDVCIRVFHRGRRDLVTTLMEEYEEDTVASFLFMFDDFNKKRIRTGLNQAAADLTKLPENERGIRALDQWGIHAFFEALTCEPVLKDEQFLAQHFDKPFELVQTKKRLKLTGYSPAMTSFLFSFNQRRRDWAVFMWSKVKTKMTGKDFEWYIRDPLLSAMRRVEITALEVEFVPTFWSGVCTILGQLDNDLITHQLRALDIDVCRLALEHLQLDSSCFRDLLTAIRELLIRGPSDFWDAMGTISPQTVVEQIFNSPVLDRHLLQAGNNSREGAAELQELFDWVEPFLRSIQTTNQTPACRALANQFLGRLQADKYARAARSYCYQMGLNVFGIALQKINSSKNKAVFLDAATVSDLLQLIGLQIQGIVQEAEVPENKQSDAITSQLALTIVQQSLTLDCLSLGAERDVLLSGKELSHEISAHSDAVWKGIIRGVKPGSTALATAALQGVRILAGQEKFPSKAGSSQPKQQRQFNEKFDRVSGFIAEFLERVADFGHDELDALFQEQAAAEATFATLLASQQETHVAAVELLKAVSLQETREDAVRGIVESFYNRTLSAFAVSVRSVIRAKIFSPASRMLKLSDDVIDALCDPQDGLLRTRTLDDDEVKATEELWRTLWRSLSMIFSQTEAWSNMGYDKNAMMEFCRETMDLADKLFDQYSIFASALEGVLGSLSSSIGDDTTKKELLQNPRSTLAGMLKWLRLRDEYLSTKAVTLISKLLIRLQEVEIQAEDDDLLYIEYVLSGQIKNKIPIQQKAELENALETHMGHALKKAEEEQKKPAKQSSISSWVTPGGTIDTSFTSSRPVVKREETADDQLEKILAESSRAAESYKNRFANRMPDVGIVSQQIAQKKGVDAAEFKRKREEEKAAKKKRDAVALAEARKRANLTGFEAQTAGAGSALRRLGVQDKDHSVRGEGMMVSSDESSDEEGDDLDAELFGKVPKAKKEPVTKTAMLAHIPQGPVKKQRQVRSAKDMRARLAPDLGPLHKVILGWDYFHDGDYPPGTRDNYTAVPNTFQHPGEYKMTFQPLLTLEAWQGFVKAREDTTFKPYEITIVSRSSVDAFVEFSTTMSHQDNKDISIGEGDVILVSESRQPTSHADAPHCLSRVQRVNRKKATLEITYRTVPGNSFVSKIAPRTSVYGAKIQSLTSLEREYGALLGLQYYDLCDEIVRAKPSPLLSYTDKQLQPLIDNYNLNRAQAKAIRSAVDNDAFTLIQGPPGSGKTKTIVAIAGALLTGTFGNQGTLIQTPAQQGQKGPSHPAKKLLVCAPSNAAVDELVMRFKDGVKTTTGQTKKVQVVRLGRSDAININVKDVTLEELVVKKLNVNSDDKDNARGETQQLMSEHQAISAKLRETREALDKAEAEGSQKCKELRDDMNALRDRKTALGNLIDNSKNKEQAAGRQADLNRKRAQQQVLDEAHIICATLSGSGHDMFQHLNIEFETVIIDEAAQCVEMSALIPLKYGCAKAILVGDPKQLPPTVLSKQAASFQYEQSLFVRMQKNHPNDVHLLDTQYRMHPEISSFPSQQFYDGRLLDGDDMAVLRKRPWHASLTLGPYRFFDVKGQHETSRGHSLINQAEVKAAMMLYDRLTTDFRSYDFRGKIGIITPYKSQLRELKDRFSGQYGPTILETVEFNTTDAFQGRESEVIIFSCVRASASGGIGFLQDVRRMNVGLTRAKCSLWVLGNSQSLVRGEFWRKLVEDAQTRDRYTTGDIPKLLSKPFQGEVNGDMGTLPDAPRTATPSSIPERTKMGTPGNGVPEKGQVLKQNGATKAQSKPATAVPNINSEASSRQSSVDSTAMKREPTNTELKRKRSTSSTEGNDKKSLPLKSDARLDKRSRTSTPAAVTPEVGFASNEAKKEEPDLDEYAGGLKPVKPMIKKRPAAPPAGQPGAPPRMPPKKKKEVNVFMKSEHPRKTKPG